jgi:hypothetical protein
MVCLSTAEAEFVAATEAAKELLKEYAMYIVIGIIVIFGIYIFSKKEGRTPIRTPIRTSIGRTDNVNTFLGTE